MFNGASLFNQDVSGWCVNRIGSEPNNFKSMANSTWRNDTSKQPEWGVCNSNVSVILSDTDVDNLLEASDTVTITASFSEAMTATPTISITGVVTNVAMLGGTASFTYNYTWDVDSGGTPSSGTYYATVAGTASATGGAYSGTESITFTVDSTAPTVTLTDTDADNFINTSQVVTITATFNESMASSGTYTNPETTFGNPFDTFTGSFPQGKSYAGDGIPDMPYNNTVVAVDLENISTCDHGVVAELGGGAAATALGFDSNNQQIIVVVGKNPDNSSARVRIAFSTTPFLGKSGTFYIVNQRGSPDTVTVYFIEGGPASGNQAIVCGTGTFTLDITSSARGWWGTNAWGFGRVEGAVMDMEFTNDTVDFTGTIIGARVWVKDYNNSPASSVSIPSPFQTGTSNGNLPRISIPGVASAVLMTKVQGSNSYTYRWDTSICPLSEGTYAATVSGTDAIGNAYVAGTQSITLQ